MGLLNQLIDHLGQLEHQVAGTHLAQSVKADLDHLCGIYDDAEKATAQAVEAAELHARNWLNSRLGLTLPAPVDPAAAAAATADPAQSAPLESADPASVPGPSAVTPVVS